MQGIESTTDTPKPNELFQSFSANELTSIERNTAAYKNGR